MTECLLRSSAGEWWNGVDGREADMSRSASELGALHPLRTSGVGTKRRTEYRRGKGTRLTG
jgi:hypothetical protein